MNRRVGLRLVIAVLATASLYVAPPVAATCGVCFARCINSCNQTQMVCYDRCALDCAPLLAIDPAAFDVCRETCNAVCASYAHECKVTCQIAKEPIP